MRPAINGPFSFSYLPPFLSHSFVTPCPYHLMFLSLPFSLDHSRGLRTLFISLEISTKSLIFRPARNSFLKSPLWGRLINRVISDFALQCVQERYVLLLAIDQAESRDIHRLLETTAIPSFAFYDGISKKQSHNSRSMSSLTPARLSSITVLSRPADKSREYGEMRESGNCSTLHAACLSSPHPIVFARVCASVTHRPKA